MMKISGVIDPQRTVVDAGNQRLDVLFIYEDLGTGLRARQVFDQVASALKPEVDFQAKLWRFDLLRDPAMRDLVADEAASAGIVILSAHGQSELPVAISLWMKRWLARKGTEPATLVISLDPEARDSEQAKGLVEALRADAEPAGVNVFVHAAGGSRKEGRSAGSDLPTEAEACPMPKQDVLGCSKPQQEGV
jgi:hypothetical protein